MMIPFEVPLEGSERFNFPVSLHSGSIYTIKSLQVHLERETTTRNIPPGMFNEVYTPNKRNCDQINMLCKYCSARLVFNKMGKRFAMIFCDNQHHHVTELKKSDVVTEEISNIRKPNNEQSERSIPFYQLLQQLNGKQMIPTKVERVGASIEKNKPKLQPPVANQNQELSQHKKLRKPNDFDLLAKWLVDNNYHYDVSWTDESGKRTYPSSPQTMLVISQGMLTNLQLYGADIVSVEVRLDFLVITSENWHYHVVLFGVGDNNERPLLAGLALCASPSAENIGRAILMFLQICKTSTNSVPNCFISRQEKYADEALSWVEARRQEQSSTVIHRIYDLKDVLGRSYPWIERYYGAEQAKNVNRVFEQLTRTFDRKTFDRKWSELITDIVLRELLESLEPILHKVFLAHIGNFFVGLQRNLCSRLGNLLSQYIPSSIVQIKQLFDKVKQVDATLRHQSEARIQRNCQAIKKYPNEARLRELEEKFENVVVLYFIQIFSETKKSIVFVRNEESTDKSVVKVVANRETGEEFNIQDWVCSCGEHVRTGVPCSHLIYLAHITEGKSYCDLISNRYLRNSQQKAGSNESSNHSGKQMSTNGKTQWTSK